MRLTDEPRLIAGLQAVREALRVHGQAVRQVLLRNRDSPRLAALERFARDQNVNNIQRTPTARLDKLTPNHLHQGVLAYGPSLVALEAETVLAQGNTVIALDGVSDPQNFGAAIRSAVGVADAAVVWPEHASAPLTPTTFRASAGAVEHARLCRVPSLAQFLLQAAERDYLTVAVEGHAKKPLSDANLTRRVVLVVGSEHEGIGKRTRRACQVSAHLVRTQHIQSLNVSVAAALALYEVQRQQQK